MKSLKIRQNRGRSCLAPSIWASMCVVACMGCGPGGPKRYQISGNVTFEGAPLAVGQISFEPEAQGTGGGFAPIFDGKFDTTVDGRGHLGGKHQVRIVGFFVTNGDPNGSVDSLFKPYDQNLDLPKHTSQMDFEVPSELKLNAVRKPNNVRESANE